MIELDQINQLLDATITQLSAGQLMAVAQQLPHLPGDDYVKRKADRTCNRIARQLERLKHLDLAAQCYATSQEAPATERRIRILEKQNDLKGALALCEHLLHNSHHPDELTFAERFYEKLKKKLGQPIQTSALYQPETIQLELAKPELAIELTVAEHFQQRGDSALYLENSLFCGLFGLWFWEIIFAPVKDAFFNPFQRAPRDLNSPEFYSKRKTVLEDRLEALHQSDWQQQMKKAAQTKRGLANVFVNWDYLSDEIIDLLLQRIPPHHLKAVFGRMIKAPGLYRNGFPDLIVMPEQGGYYLLEVKGPGDTLQNNQIHWFKLFAQHTIPAKLAKVSFINEEI